MTVDRGIERYRDHRRCGVGFHAVGADKRRRLQADCQQRIGLMTPSSPTQHHWVIGDVHGCAQSLRDLVERLPAGDRLVLCGDVINRGPRILEAMELAWELVASGRASWLQGNHEADLVMALRQGPRQGLSGLAGCDTYRQLGDRLCRTWLERLEQLPRVHWGQGWVATHAGFDPLSWQPHLNIRAPFWQAYDGRFGTVIVGHTPGPSVRRYGSIVMVDSGACYGGELSAYCPETGDVVSVPGLRPWSAGLGLVPQGVPAPLS